MRVRQSRVEMMAVDCLLIFSDGILEADDLDGLEFGDAGLLAAAAGSCVGTCGALLPKEHRRTIKITIQ